MLTGKKGLDYEIKEVSSNIIMDKCNSKAPEHEVTISDLSNWIIDRFDSFTGENYILSILFTKGYIKCKKAKATHYASVTKKGSDISQINIWLFYSACNV